MTLEKGRRIGPYEVLSPLGAGGMGEVWRATDTRLAREVALKLLPAAFASDPDRIARFEREAKLLASLSHTNIAGLFSFEEATIDGTSSPVRFLAMELAEGEDLAQRLKRGAIPVDEAIAIAKQVAEALEAAHEKGIVHRDLKPANVRVSADGHVKVLDFGLAKAWSGDGEGALDRADGSLSPTLARTGTAAGLILGTAAYMSPEQARGKPVDKRADVWAFGVLVFEMLTGKRLFDGETVSDVLAAVLTREPPWNELPAATPPSVRRLLRRCVERNPSNRQHDIADVRVGLEEALRGAPEEEAGASPGATAPFWRGAVPWATLAGLLAVALAVSVKNREAPAPLKAFKLRVHLGAPVYIPALSGAPLAISPDGTRLAFIARAGANEPFRLYVRPLDALEAYPLSGTDSATSPFFSPDSRWLGFFADGQLKKVAVTGGAPVSLCDAPDNLGGTWSEDGTIVFTGRSASGTGLSRVSAEGGTPEILTTVDQSAGPSMHSWPQALPAGGGVLFTAGIGVGDLESANLVVQPVPKGPTKIVHRGGYYGRYLRSGHLVFIREGSLFAAAFDPVRLELRGAPVPVLTGMTSDPFVGNAAFAVSDGGTLVYAPGSSRTSESFLSVMSADGRKERRGIPAAVYRAIRFSPDGGTLAMELRRGRDWDVWLYDWARDAASRFTSDPAEDRDPIFTLDGRRITFASTRGDPAAHNLYWQRTDGTGVAERLTESASEQVPTTWHPNGRVLAFTEYPAGKGGDIWTLEVEGDEATGFKPKEPRPLVNSSFDEYDAAFSPDGRWLAYTSRESGHAEVYVRPYPGPGGRWQVSAGNHHWPTWSKRRKELLFLAADGFQLMVAGYTTVGDTFRVEKPRPWLPGLPPRWQHGRPFDLHPDGQRVALLEPVEAGAGRLDHVVLVQHCFDELRRLAPAPAR